MLLISILKSFNPNVLEQSESLLRSGMYIYIHVVANTVSLFLLIYINITHVYVLGMVIVNSVTVPNRVCTCQTLPINANTLHT